MSETPEGRAPAEPLIVGYDRLVMAACLAGRGFSFEEIAAKVGAPEAHIRIVLNFFGVKGRNVGKGAKRMDIVIRGQAVNLIETASGLRGIEPVDVVEKIVDLVFSDPALLQNILDDGRPVR